MPLAPKMRQQLKAKAHSLRPIVAVGNNGLTPTVTMEIDRALTDHELIKLRINSEDREERRELLAIICQESKAELVQAVGKVGVLYRKSNKEK